MARKTLQVYTEVGAKRAFAVAMAWPGWCRGARSEDAALEALVAYGPRYAKVVGRFHPPPSVSDLTVIDRVRGNATTDFGAPDASLPADAAPMGAEELTSSLGSLEAVWSAFDRAVVAARGVELAKGPRGGGRDLDAIVGHVIGAETRYVRRLAVKPPPIPEGKEWASREGERRAALDAVTRAVQDGLPDRGPRGGRLWNARAFVRRAAWHVLDHAWEIEDRSEPISSSG